MTARPAQAPCRSCPYRPDVPSGVWAPEEYAKLPEYDRPTEVPQPGESAVAMIQRLERKRTG